MRQVLAPARKGPKGGLVFAIRNPIQLAIEMDRINIVGVWLAAGLYWFTLGIAWSPSNKIYQQGLILLLWLPALLAVWPLRHRLVILWKHAGCLLVTLGALLVWAAVSASWSESPEALREAKRVGYVVFFLCSLMFFCSQPPLRSVRWLQFSGFGLALAAVVAMVIQYLVGQQPLNMRAVVIGSLGHPIIGGYVVGLAMICWFCLPPRSVKFKFIWVIGLIAMLLLIALTQSRGVWVALASTSVSLALLKGGRHTWIAVTILGLVSVVGSWLFLPYILERGSSYRPEIFMMSLEMISERPWLGLGLGSDYTVKADAIQLSFDHSHNLFTHTGIELGLVGLLLWVAVWTQSFIAAWRLRQSSLGVVLFGMLVFSSVALMFDGASLWGSPRPEWFLTWLPVGFALGLLVQSKRYPEEEKRCSRVDEPAG
ncbi:MAG TPA: O-antigen ligase domain-containing protein [Pseudomonas xinjiangensis]|uniref:O-antigen ligase domain-containing protein n=2 Tax=root TaxID=1 RepID=A0A7V1BQ21_9GAMM|nr:O-antigen ligase domain-containing protein [Halopseudomonas xinjiangensis]HEC49495.1 O-antigen ligase domain-containing protein [Halopseudomonas xinjiangensis]